MVIFSGEALQAVIEKQGLKMFPDKFRPPKRLLMSL